MREQKYFIYLQEAPPTIIFVATHENLFPVFFILQLKQF
jgi:hypothetical protein